MEQISHRSGQLSEKLYKVLLPETKRAVSAIDDWGALGTLAGPVRAENQDRLVGGQFASIDGRAFRMVALSDGMGGLSNGQEAATLTLSSLLWCLTTSNGPMGERLLKAAHFANSEVRRAFNGRAGATLSVAICTDRLELIGLNVGDSRIYGYSKSGYLRQISDDDTLAGLSHRGVAVDIRHNANALLQHVGMSDGFEPNVYAAEQLAPFDYFMLTTDGVHWVGHKLLELIAQNAGDYTQLTRRLLSLAEITGAHDNASIGTMRVDAFPPADSQLSDEMIEMEIWTPQARTVLMSEQRRTLSSPPSPARAYRYPDDDDSDTDPYKVKSTKKPRRRKKGRPLAAEQAALPMERPELVIEIDQKKTQDDESSH